MFHEILGYGHETWCGKGSIVGIIGGLTDYFHLTKFKYIEQK